MNLIQFLRIFWARRWLVLGTALACFIVATLVASALPKRYSASARLLIDTSQSDPVTGSGVTLRDARPYIFTQTELVRDPRVTGAVVDRLGLANDPATIAAYQKSGFREEDGGIRRWLANQISERVSAGQVGATSIFEIRVEGPTPEYARQVVGAVRDAYVQEALRLKTDAAGRSGAWYAEQAAKEREMLEEAEERRNAFMKANNITLTAGPGSPDVEMAKLQALQAAEAALRDKSSSALAAASEAVPNVAGDQLRVQLAAIEEEIARASEQLGPAHPAYKAALARKRVIETQLANVNRQQEASRSASASIARGSLAKLEADIRAQQQIVLARKPIYDELLALDREVELRRTLYERALSRSADLRMESDVSETSMVYLGDPIAEQTPSYPKMGRIMTLAGIFGILLGLLAALAAEFIARRVRGAEDLAYATGAPVLVSVGMPPASPLRLQMRRLLGRRSDRDDDSELQAI
ncbi:GumC family protein [Thermaurantiacus sp.]